MADLSNVTFQPQNPDALFSPDQWLNQFSNFNSKALPWPSSYVGYPTNAMGNFIAPQAGSGIPTQAQWQAGQAAPGTTINSMPAAAPPATDPNAAMIQFLQSQDQNIQSFPQGNQGGFGSGNSGPLSGAQRNQIVDNSMLINQLQRQGAAQPAAAQPAAPGGLTYPQVLALLANPGRVQTPGATVPASASSAQPAAGANNAFLRQVGGGAGMNKNFLNTLAALQGRQ